MTVGAASPSRLYLLQLSASTVPLPGGRSVEMICASYLVEKRNGEHILIDTGLPRNSVKPEGIPPSRGEKSVLST